MLKPTTDISIKINIDANNFDSDIDDKNIDFFDKSLINYVNPIFDAELFEYKPKSDKVSYYMFFNDKFEPNLSNDLVENFTDVTYKSYKTQMLSVVTGITETTFGPFQFYNVLNVDPLVTTGVTNAPIPITRPSFNNIPIYYPTFAIPFKNKLSSFGNTINGDTYGFSNKSYLFNSQLVFEYYDSVDPLRQKLIMTTLVPVSERYCTYETSVNGTKQLRPEFILDKTIDGYSFMFTKNPPYKGLYVKIFFWDALNSKKIQLIPTNQQTTANRWVLTPKTYNYRLEYLYFKFSDNYTYDILMFNQQKNDYDISCFDFDLFELVIDEYWSQYRIPINRPVPPLPLVYNGSLFFDKTDLNGGNPAIFPPIDYTKLDTVFSHDFGPDKDAINTVFQNLFKSLFTDKEQRLILNADDIEDNLLNILANTSAPTKSKIFFGDVVKIVNRSNKTYKLKSLSNDIDSVSGVGKKTDTPYKLKLNTRLDVHNRGSSCLYSFDRTIKPTPNESIYNELKRFYDTYGSSASLLINLKVKDIINELIAIDKKDFKYDIAIKYGEIYETNLGVFEHNIIYFNHPRISGNMISSGFYHKTPKDWTQADLDFVYKREVIDKFIDKELSFFKYLFDSMVIKRMAYGVGWLNFFGFNGPKYGTVSNSNYSSHGCNNNTIKAFNGEINYTLNDSRIFPSLTYRKHYATSSYSVYNNILNKVSALLDRVSTTDLLTYIKSKYDDNALKEQMFYYDFTYYNFGKGGDGIYVPSINQIYGDIPISLYLNSYTEFNKNTIQPNDEILLYIRGYIGNKYHMIHFNGDSPIDVVGNIKLTFETIENIPKIEEYKINIESKVLVI